MPEKNEIELFISDDGELKVHIKGIKGPGCLKVLDGLAKEGGIVKEQKLSAEYYEKPLTQTKQSSQIKKKLP